LRQIEPEVGAIGGLGHIAPRLKNEERPIAEGYDDVSVLFADMVGFTSWAEQIDPKRMVSMLDRLFREFDELAEKHGLEKIKTIGDAYMLAAGVPERRDDVPFATFCLVAGIHVLLTRFPLLRLEPFLEKFLLRRVESQSDNPSRSLFVVSVCHDGACIVQRHATKARSVEIE